MASFREIATTAKELTKVSGIKIKFHSKEEILKERVIEAFEQMNVEEHDLSDDALIVIEEIGGDISSWAEVVEVQEETSTSKDPAVEEISASLDPTIEEYPEEEEVEESEKKDEKSTQKGGVTFGEKYSRDRSVCDAFTYDKLTRQQLAVRADELYVKKGGKSNVKESGYIFRTVARVLTHMGYIKFEDGLYWLVRD